MRPMYADFYWLLQLLKSFSLQGRRMNMTFYYAKY